MWTQWPTAPWCSGSSSAAGHISGKCAARPARDTERPLSSPRKASTSPLHYLPLSLATCSPFPWTLPTSGTIWPGTLVGLTPGLCGMLRLRAEASSPTDTGAESYIPLEGGAAESWSDSQGGTFQDEPLSLSFCNHPSVVTFLVLLHLTLATGLVAVSHSFLFVSRATRYKFKKLTV